MNARQSLGWSLNKLSEQTHLQKQILMDLEKNNYSDLPVAPYVKAFLVTLSKHLNLDAAAIISRFYQETGLVPEPISNSTGENNSIPVKNKNRLTPVIIIAFLLIILALVFSLLKSDLFSGIVKTDTGEKAAMPKAIRNSDNGFPDKQRTEQSSPLKESVTADLLVFESLIDTVWIGVKRKNRTDASTLLLRGKTWKVAYSDTVRIHTGVMRAVRLYTGGKTLVPKKRRFMVYKSKLIE
jgi:hypothetical protein